MKLAECYEISASIREMRKLLKKYGFVPDKLVTDMGLQPAT